jgi:hypothetical protein
MPTVFFFSKFKLAMYGSMDEFTVPGQTSPFKSPYGFFMNPLIDLAVQSPASYPTAIEPPTISTRVVEAANDALSFPDILENYERLEQKSQKPVARAVPLMPIMISKKVRLVQRHIFQPFVSCETTEMTVHQLRALLHRGRCL